MTTLNSRVRPKAIANECPKWIPATWEDYLVYRDDRHSDDRVGLFFNDNYLFVDLGKEGSNRASIARLY